MSKKKSRPPMRFTGDQFDAFSTLRTIAGGDGVANVFLSLLDTMRYDSPDDYDSSHLSPTEQMMYSLLIANYKKECEAYYTTCRKREAAARERWGKDSTSEDDAGDDSDGEIDQANACNSMQMDANACNSIDSMQMDANACNSMQMQKTHAKDAHTSYLLPLSSISSSISENAAADGAARLTMSDESLKAAVRDLCKEAKEDYGFKSITKPMRTGLEVYLKRLPYAVVEMAFENAAANKSEPTWNYVDTILRRYISEGIDTVQKVQADMARHSNKSAETVQTLQPSFLD